MCYFKLLSGSSPDFLCWHSPGSFARGAAAGPDQRIIGGATSAPRWRSLAPSPPFLASPEQQSRFSALFHSSPVRPESKNFSCVRELRSRAAWAPIGRLVASVVGSLSLPPSGVACHARTRSYGFVVERAPRLFSSDLSGMFALCASGAVSQHMHTSFRSLRLLLKLGR